MITYTQKHTRPRTKFTIRNIYYLIMIKWKLERKKNYKIKTNKTKNRYVYDPKNRNSPQHQHFIEKKTNKNLNLLIKMNETAF